MTTVTEFNPEPDTRLVRKLLLLLALSAIIHSVSLSLLRWSPNYSSPAALPIELSVVGSTENSQHENYLITAEESLQEIIKPSSQRIPAARSNSAVASTSTAGGAPQSNTIIYDLPLSPWSVSACTAQQKRTAVHVCAEGDEVNDYHFGGAHEQYLAGLFREERSVSAERATDLRSIDALLAQQAAVDEALAKLDIPPAHLLNERRRISSEIARIDNKYSSVNLLKVIGSTYKTTKKLANPGRKD